MNSSVPMARLYLIAGATLVFLGGLLVAVGRWNRAETDRAFVDSAAAAARSPPPGGVRYWAPTHHGLPDAARRAMIEAMDRVRGAPALAPAPPIQIAPLPARPPVLPRTGTLPPDKPEAAVK